MNFMIQPQLIIHGNIEGNFIWRRRLRAYSNSSATFHAEETLHLIILFSSLEIFCSISTSKLESQLYSICLVYGEKWFGLIDYHMGQYSFFVIVEL